MRVFIVCPARRATGGTELLHQFSKCLKERNVECYMLYLEKEKSLDCPVPDTFEKYGVKYASQYIDAEDSILVLPESQVVQLDVCQKGIAMIWWLSVDYYIKACQEFIDEKGMDVYSLKDRKNVMHFVQSQYAKEFLKNALGIEESYYLKDYINDEIVDVANAYRDRMDRTNYCLYNPMKGLGNLKPIIENCRPDIQWVPLKGLKPQEMAVLMCRAKVYVDFGEHPGKDRIPREAAICGCCVITNKQGSAAYLEDVCIPDSYKIDDMTNTDAVLELIYDCIDNYDERKNEYQEYRTRIAGEKDEFLRDGDSCLGRLKSLVENKGIDEEKNVDMQHLMILDSLKKFVDQIGLRLEVAKLKVEDNDRDGLINDLLDVDYLLHVLQESICYEEVDVAEW